ncbi:MAG: tetratricopeptide repeat protein [Bradymonadia bacterium]|jgi:hypothetical protein
MNELTNRLARKHFDRGRTFELQDRLDDALQAYRQAVDLGPDFVEPYFALGRLEATLGQCERALPALERARAFGDDPEVAEWRGYALGRLRRYDEALAEYLLALSTGAPGVRLNAARMLLALGRWDEADAMLAAAEEPEAEALRAALPRYREFTPPSSAGRATGRDPMDDARAARYLAAATLVLGTLGDGGMTLAAPSYLLLSPRHCAVTVGRLLRLVRERRWRFDAVLGQGPAHGPAAQATAHLLDVPLVLQPSPGDSVLMVSAVVNGPEDAVALKKRLAGHAGKVMHFAFGFVPGPEPTTDEPEVVGHIGRCAVEWYRVEPWARMRAVNLAVGSEEPAFEVGPAFVDPNAARVTQAIIEACERQRTDAVAASVLAWYGRHPGTRAFANEPLAAPDARREP